jgi:hypothetical protein
MGRCHELNMQHQDRLQLPEIIKGTSRLFQQGTMSWQKKSLT